MKRLFRKVTTDNSVLLPWRKRISVLAFAMLQNGLAGGIIFGWASIDKTMLAETEARGGAGLTIHESTQIFAISSCVAMISSLILGAVLDFFGPRVCAMLCSFITGLGCQIFAASTTFSGFALGASLLGLGGPAIGSAIIHIANLFPKNEFLVMSCLSGSVAFSFSVLAVFDIIWSAFGNLSFRTLFGFYAWIVYALVIGSFMLYPDEPYEEFEEDIIEEEAELLAKHFSESTSPTKVYYDPPEQTTRLSELHEHHHDRRHSNHIQSFASGPRLSIEQPLNSYLRDNPKDMVKTDSFRAAEKVMKQGDKSKARAISLKDQPFSSQFCSAAYLRAFVVFFTSVFFTNFYVASLSTELADLQLYSHPVQHQMTRDFTIIMSMGMLVSVIVGSLIDYMGIEICTAITLISGQLQNLILLIFGKNHTLTIASFVFYTIFRQFLYPVFIASLTSRLGFKYFGILLGISFAFSGLAQPFFSTLSDTLQGDCHLYDDITTVCNHGHWIFAHILQIIILGGLLIIPWLDYRDRIQREQNIKEILSENQSELTTYGSNL